MIPWRRLVRSESFPYESLVKGTASWSCALTRIGIFPKGRVDPGEAPLSCAIRELKEETTFCEPDFCWGEEFVETVPYSHGKIARYYLAEISEGEVSLPVSEELGKPENDEFRWVSGEEAQRLLPPRLQPVIQWAREKVENPGHFSKLTIR